MRIGGRCALIAALLFGSGPARGESTTCFENWSDAAAIVAKEALRPVSEIGRLTRQQTAAVLVRTTLCNENGRYVYRLVLRHGNGALRNLTVDARQPFAR